MTVKIKHMKITALDKHSRNYRYDKTLVNSLRHFIFEVADKNTKISPRFADASND